MKSSDTRWLAHEHCVKAVKASYSSIVLALEKIYKISHMSLHNSGNVPTYYILPQVAKLSHALQTKHLGLSLISSLVVATFNSFDDAILPSAN